MRSKAILIAIIISVSLTGFSQAYFPPKIDIDTVESQPLRSTSNSSFTSGEELKYIVHYGWMDAGEAILKVENSPYSFNGRQAYHVVGTGKSLGAFNWVFKVDDRFETYIDKKGMFPYRFIRNCDEGGYKINQDYTFIPSKSAVKTEKGDTLQTPNFVQDMISAYYFARTLDYSKAKKGDIFTVETIVDGEIYPLQIKYVGKETIKIRAGKFRCMKFIPVLQEGRIFEDADDLNVWITDDENKIPILVKSKIMVGSVKLEMTEWSGLANSLAKVD